MKDSWPFPWKFNQKNYSANYLACQVTEAQAQKDIISLLQMYKVDVVPIDAGGRRQRGRMMAAAKSSGICIAGSMHLGAEIPRGFADLEATLAPHGQSLYIEVKSPAWLGDKNKIIRRAGQPSEEQLEFLLSKSLRGAAVLVAWSSWDVEAQLITELEMNRQALR